MGYTTDFYGYIEINPALSPELKEYINRFSASRRMGRNVSRLMTMYPNVAENGFVGPDGTASYGTEGEYFCLPNNYDGASETITDYNHPPATQPGLWCQWVIADDGTYIEWDGGEKFYHAEEWMRYIIDNFITPFGHKCNGVIEAQGEDHDDAWSLIVRDNVVTIKDTSSNAFRRVEGCFIKVMEELDSIIKHIDYSRHLEELLVNATPEQLELLTEIRRRLVDVYERNEGFLA